METDKQTNNTDKPWLWKKGQSGNLKGRPPGKTMKEYSRDYLARMTTEEKDEFFVGLPKIDIWKMAEGNPATETDVTSGGEKIMVVPAELIEKNDITSKPVQDSEGHPQV